MSSKSRKTKAERAKPAAKAGSLPGAAASEEGHGHEHEGLLSDEVIHAPKGQSRLRFFLLVLLVIVLLVIFVLPGEIQSCVSGTGRPREAMASWVHPTQGKIEYDYTQFIDRTRQIDTALRIDPIMRYRLGIQSADAPSQKDYLRIIVLEDLARDAGIQISDADLAENLRAMIDSPYSGLNGSTQTYFQIADSFPGGRVAVEGAYRRVLRVARYLELMAQLAAVPDPVEIEELWSTDHVEHAFDYVQVPVADLKEEARAGVPADDELSAWFDEQSAQIRNAFLEPERRTVELVSYVDPETTAAAGLVEAYPPPADVSAEEFAKNYYDRVFFTRFLRPASEKEEGGEEESSEDAVEQQFLTFDEVRDVCLAEAPVRAALDQWVEDLNARQAAGEEVDLAADAERFGLKYRKNADPLSLDEYRIRKDLGGTAVGMTVFQTQPGRVAPTVQVTESEMIVLRTLERVDRILPPFEAIRGKVADRWVDERAKELALEKLRAIRDPLADAEPPEPPAGEEAPPPGKTADETTFRAAVEAAGLEVKRRDWLDKGGRPGEDPQATEDAHVFLRGALYTGLPDEAVAEPALNRTGTIAYLVRHVGSRPVPVDRMTKDDYEMYRNRSVSVARTEAMQAFDLDSLAVRYELSIVSGDDEDEDEPADEGASGQEG